MATNIASIHINIALLSKLLVTALATLSLGEHYLIDLIVAVPFTYALQGIFLRGLPLNHTARWQCILVGTALWLAWVVALRIGIEVFIGLPWLSWSAVLFSLVFSTVYYRKMAKAQEEWFNSPAAIEISVTRLLESNVTQLNIRSPDAEKMK